MEDESEGMEPRNEGDDDEDECEESFRFDQLFEDAGAVEQYLKTLYSGGASRNIVSQKDTAKEEGVVEGYLFDEDEASR